MRVLVAGTYGEWNGIETYTRHLVIALRGAGHEVLLADRSPETAPDRPPGAAGLPGRTRLRPRSWPAWRIAGPFEAVRAASGLRAAIRGFSPDVVHVTYPELAPRTNGPVIVTAWHPETGVVRRARTSRLRGERARLGALFALSDRIALGRAAGVVATSKSVQRALGGRGRASARVSWIPPFLDDGSVRAPMKSRSGDLVMVAGKLDDPRKGLRLAIDAVASLRRDVPSARLVLIGGWSSGAAPADLPEFCEPRGFMEPDALASALRAAGCLLLASVWEEFGYVGLEALAAGTPVACTRLPGFEGIGGGGLIVAERRDADGLAAAAKHALGLDAFTFPAACRASSAVRELERLYDAVAR